MKETTDNAPAEWEILGETQHADCKVFTVARRSCRHPDLGEADFFVVKPSDWAMAIAETEPGRFVFVNQFRFGCASLSWEFPSGCMDPGEDPIEAATRELLEETGFAGSEPVLIGKTHPNPAIQDNWCYFVLIRKAKQVQETSWDEHEELETRILALEEIEEMAIDGRMHHALGHAALLFLRKAGVS